jgi:hypothetical protein
MIRYIQKSRILLTAILFLSAGTVFGQVNLAPTSIFIHDQSGVASLYVSNNSTEEQEVSIAFEFSYPGSDSQGNLVTITNDSLTAARYGITDNLRVFPRQFVLKPGAQQTVRIQARPINNKPDGVYWTRVIVSSNTAARDIDKIQVNDGIGTKINYVFRQNIPAFYLKGKVQTGLITGNLATSVEEGKLVALASLKPSGNAPFNGSVTARLSDSRGKEIIVHKQTLVAYSDVLRRVEIDLPAAGLLPGNYTLTLTYETVRADIPPSDLVQSLPVMQSVNFEVK